MGVRIEKIDLKKLFESEIDILKNHPQAHNIVFDLNYSETVPLFSDVVRMKTIFGNILSNAVKYSDPKKEKSFVHIDARVDGESLEVEVSDNGIGIAKENIDRIFEIFFRATTHASGTGLGLHIVKDTVARLNGKVKVKSELGKGTTFKTIIPNLYYSSMKNGKESVELKRKAVL
jgi:signal transduction histidine kinase